MQVGQVQTQASQGWQTSVPLCYTNPKADASSGFLFTSPPIRVHFQEEKALIPYLPTPPWKVKCVQHPFPVLIFVEQKTSHLKPKPTLLPYLVEASVYFLFSFCFQAQQECIQVWGIYVRHGVYTQVGGIYCAVDPQSAPSCGMGVTPALLSQDFSPVSWFTWSSFIHLHPPKSNSRSTFNTMFSISKQPSQVYIQRKQMK